jgi:hypothetical protein
MSPKRVDRNHGRIVQSLRQVAQSQRIKEFSLGETVALIRGV